MRCAAAARVLVMAAALVGALAGCSTVPSSSARSVRSTPPPTSANGTVLRQVRLAIDTFDAAADGPASRQQDALAGLVDAGQRSVQRSCAAATGTLTFEPVYARLAPAPGWAPSKGTLSGAVYALPTLIRVHTGNRITGTDLTDLHVGLHHGRAWLPALCLS